MLAIVLPCLVLVAPGITIVQADVSSTIPECDAAGWSANVSAADRIMRKSGREWNYRDALGNSIDDGYGLKETSPDGFSYWFKPDNRYIDNSRGFTQDKRCTTTAGTELKHYKFYDKADVNASGPEMYAEVKDEGVIRYYMKGNMIAYYVTPINEGTTTVFKFNKSTDEEGNLLLSVVPENQKFLIRNKVNMDFTWNDQTNQFRIAPKDKNAIAAFDMVSYSSRERGLVMDANGGAWNDGSKTSYQVIDTTYKPVTENRPTRAGYQIKSWNTKADGTGDDVSTRGASLKDGQTIYAIWEKNAGNPTEAAIDCATRTDGGVLCSVVAKYAGSATSRKRELTATGTNALAWSGDGPITGVRLDADGYDADQSCVPTRSGGGGGTRNVIT